uniref:WGS project CBMI000000000 data, contig CS3069_c003718 n=1 Tax=Fusarium clavum TaxID=2594811 RepID=A0A090MK15_9HYPO|nr:unnamed protein product [Fusarium clavum]
MAKSVGYGSLYPGPISSYFTRDLFPTVAYTLFPAAAVVCFLLDKWLRRPADRSNAGPSFSPNIKVPGHAEVHIRYSLNNPQIVRTPNLSLILVEGNTVGEKAWI